MNVVAEDNALPRVLVITSYNPDTQSTASFLSAFSSVVQPTGADNDNQVIVETLNCLAYSEAKTWKERMEGILEKHVGEKRPDLVIVLGQEAWSAFLSQDDARFQSLPVMCAMVSRNTILLPDEEVALPTWMPESKDVLKDFPQFNIVGGYVYEYSLDKNMELVKKLYPNTNEIVFLSDNSFGGVNMQALIKSQMLRYPQYTFSFLDGRLKPLIEVSDNIGSLSPHCMLLCGTWRVGPSDDFVLKSTTHVLRDANPLLPVFTISTVGLGHWALGGYVPGYRNLGEDVGHMALDFIHSGGKAAPGPSIVKGKYVFDMLRMKELDIDESLLPEHSEIVNREETFWDRYRYEIISTIVIIALLLASLIVTVCHLRRIQKLKEALERQSEELAQARDDAEKASEMKTRFIQNINHEIRTPLNAIVGFAQVFANADTPQMKKYAAIIERNSEDLLKLVGDVVELSNLDYGKKQPPKPVVMSELCMAALRQVDSKRVDDVKVSFVPPTDDRPYTMYRHLVELVIVNLLHNAFKFTVSGTVTLKCEVLPDGKKMKVTVTDTGCGIPADKHDMIFERFTKLDEFKQGGGLGLAICRSAAQQMGATVELDPTYRTGSRFIFIFPINH